MSVDRTPPPGFEPIDVRGGFVQVNGPLFGRHDGSAMWVGFRVEQRHCNLMGTCHGGMMAMFCDMLLPVTLHRSPVAPAVAAAPHASGAEGRLPTDLRHRFLPTISLQIDYLAPAPLGAWLEGEAEPLRITRSLVFAQGLVTADGVPCARVSGVFKIGPEVPSNAVE